MRHLTVAIESADETRLGDGPLSSVTSWSHVSRLDETGDIRFTLPAVDQRTLLFANANRTYYARAQTSRGYPPGVRGRVEVGYGMIKETSVNTQTRMMQVSGPGIAGELTHTGVGSLFLHGAAEDDPMPAASVFPAIMASSLTWAVVTSTGAAAAPSKDIEPYQFGDETHLAALGKIADLTGDHFRAISPDEQARLSLGPRHIIWLPTTPAGFDAAWSGLIARDSGETVALDGNTEVCLIDGGLQEVIDRSERATRVKPRGGGNAGARLFLNGTTRWGATTTPGDYTDAGSPGFTLHIDIKPELSYLKHDASEPSPGDVIEVAEPFRDIAAIEDEDVENAANALFDAALVWLRRHIIAQKAYQLRLRKVARPLLPGTSLWVICRHWTDRYRWINVNAHMMVLTSEPVYEAGSDGDPVWNVQVTE